jgi:hypothetical protein
MFSDDQPPILCQTSDPLLPQNVASGLSATLAALLAENASMIHMEQDAVRAFTHTVINDQVIYQDGISDPVFNLIMASQAQLIAIFDPE